MSSSIIAVVIAFVALLVIIFFLLGSGSPGEEVQIATPSPTAPITSEQSVESSVGSAASDLGDAITDLDEIEQILGS